MDTLEGLLTELKALVPRLQQFEPQDENFVQAEQRTLVLKKEIELALQQRDAIDQLKKSYLLTEMKRLVPELARHEIAELKLADFVLGLIYLQPYAAFEQVYRGYSADYGKELSIEARKSLDANHDTSHVYGEICFFPFADLIRSIAPNVPENAVFYDLGSGTGKAVVAASLLHPFHKVCGIELLEPLVQFATKRKRALEKQLQHKQGVEIEFQHGDLLTNSWVDGDVIFCHGTCFTDKTWQQISLAAEALRQGALFVSTSHILKSALFEVMETRLFKMSWGTCTLYIHRRRRIGRWAAAMLRGGSASRTDLRLNNNSVDSKPNEVRP